MAQLDPAQPSYSLRYHGQDMPAVDHVAMVADNRPKGELMAQPIPSAGDEAATRN